MRLFKSLVLFYFSLSAAAVPVDDISKYLSQNYEVNAVNLDLFSADPAVTSLFDHAVEQYLFETYSHQDTWADQDQNEVRVMVNEELHHVPAFRLSYRDELNSEKMNYVLEKSPRSVFIFQDTHSVMVPDVDTIVETSDESLRRRVRDGDTFVYHEFDFSETHSPIREDIKLPAGPCLSFEDDSGSGAGSVGISHKTKIQLNINEEYGVSLGNNGNLTMALNYVNSFKSSTTTTISGSYTCSTSNSVSTRLTYSPITIEFQPHMRSLMYNSWKSSIKTTEWQDMGPMKHITDRPPRYSCEYGTVEELNCDVPASGLHRFNGYVFNSTIISSKPTLF